jgi:hypothetical protein
MAVSEPTAPNGPASYDVALIGCGEQAKRFYYPELEALSRRHPVRLRLVVDLADRADAVRGLFVDRQLQPDRLVLVDPAYRERSNLPVEAEEALADLLRRRQLNRLLVITEPKAHKPYVLWGARNSVEVLCEKPLTAVTGLSTHDQSRAWELYADWVEIATSLRQGRVMLVATRRVNEGYRTIYDYLRDFLGRFEVPITHIDGIHAEGMWNLPDEFIFRENHPYRYGYGKLLHSGYHYVDLTTRIAMLNAMLAGKAADELVLTAQATMAGDFFEQFDNARYRDLLATDRFQETLSAGPAAHRYLGETDVQAMGQFRRDGKVLTSVSLSLQQTSVNRRSWNYLPDNLRQDGRLQRERLTVHVGHLLTIEAVARYTTPEEEEATGVVKPFMIQISRNVGVVGGEPYAEIRPGSGNARTLTASARREILQRWLTGDELDSDLLDHQVTILALSAVYASLAQRRDDADPTVSVPLARWVPGHDRVDGQREPVTHASGLEARGVS